MRTGEKCKKQDITRAELENSMRNEIKETQGIAGKKNAAPGLRTGFLLVRHSGCDGVKISAPGLGQLLRAVDRLNNSALAGLQCDTGTPG